MKSLVTIGVAALGLAFTAAQPAQAAFVMICASTTCGSASGDTTFNVTDFEEGFDVNGSQVQIWPGESGPSVGSPGRFLRRRRGAEHFLRILD